MHSGGGRHGGRRPFEPGGYAAGMGRGRHSELGRGRSIHDQFLQDPMAAAQGLLDQREPMVCGMVTV